ncbi:DUF805 domain-containing protein [Flavobacterium sp. XGLA_31]|uniref:DUF805 domain-containing protein n=1 Tax=Flavobacterium sp. XGLA_31 TaxID=3447666 RepID=UPI003F307362
MIEWYKKVVFENYANFKGRARRSEYWYFTLANIIIAILTMIIDEVLHLKIGSSNSGVLNSLYSLLVFIPGLAVAVRRLHDIGKSGWLILLAYVVMIGAAGFMIATTFSGLMGGGAAVFGMGMIVSVVVILAVAIWMLVLFCTEGTAGPNQYGADPKGVGEEINEIGVE